MSDGRTESETLRGGERTDLRCTAFGPSGHSTSRCFWSPWACDELGTRGPATRAGHETRAFRSVHFVRSAPGVPCAATRAPLAAQPPDTLLTATLLAEAVEAARPGLTRLMSSCAALGPAHSE
jgi:hypothetical protein